jgi:hypothetical protein
VGAIGRSGRRRSGCRQGPFAVRLRAGRDERGAAGPTGNPETSPNSGSHASPAQIEDQRQTPARVGRHPLSCRGRPGQQPRRHTSFALEAGLPPSRWSRPTTAVNTCRCGQSDGVGSLKSCKTKKEAYAVRRTVPRSSEIQMSIEELLSKGMVDDPQKMLSELARLGARLINPTGGRGGVRHVAWSDSV